MKRNRGFSIIELMIVVTVVGITLAFALPSFQSTLRNNRAGSRANEVLAAAHLARSEAVKRNRYVQLCPTASETATTCTGSTDWSSGWMIFVDENENLTKEAADDILQRGVPSGDTVVTASAGLTQITYNSRGLGVGLAGLMPAPGFVVAPAPCTAGQAHRRVIEVSPVSGRLSVIRVDACP